MYQTMPTESKYNVYEYKVFETSLSTRNLPAINELLKRLVDEGWEPMNVDYVRYTVFARKPKMLND